MKSTITRERLQEITEDGFLKHGESKELARMALAAMDSEPVILYRERNPYNGLTTGWQELTENELSFLKENAGENAEFLKLYRHAQPAPVVPDELAKAFISAIEKEQDRLSDEDYLMDSRDCIDVIREELERLNPGMLAVASQEAK